MKLALKFSITPVIVASVVRFLCTGLPAAVLTEGIFGLGLVMWTMITIASIIGICNCEPDAAPRHSRDY